ncbi:MAG: hypothetical protein ACO1OB_30370 [Archangium sp.]
MNSIILRTLFLHSSHAAVCRKRAYFLDEASSATSRAAFERAACALRHTFDGGSPQQREVDRHIANLRDSRANVVGPTRRHEAQFALS